MSNNYYRPAETGIGEGYAKALRKRLRMLVFFSTMTVALAFGVSFYFGLVSGGSSITGQFPELESIVVKMKNLLLMNTLGFVAVIIASFYLLARLVLNRIFLPLAAIERKMTDFNDSGRLPEGCCDNSGPFGSLSESFGSFVTRLEAEAEEEAVILDKALSALPETGDGISEQLAMLSRRKARALGRMKDDPDSKTSTGESEVFMQPV